MAAVFLLCNGGLVTSTAHRESNDSRGHPSCYLYLYPQIAPTNCLIHSPASYSFLNPHILCLGTVEKSRLTLGHRHSDHPPGEMFCPHVWKRASSEQAKRP